MKGPGAFLSALTALWLAIGGLVLLALHTGAVEVLCIEVAGVALAILAAGRLIADSRPGCGHDPACSDVRSSS